MKRTLLVTPVKQVAKRRKEMEEKERESRLFQNIKLPIWFTSLNDSVTFQSWRMMYADYDVTLHNVAMNIGEREMKRIPSTFLLLMSLPLVPDVSGYIATLWCLEYAKWHALQRDPTIEWVIVDVSVMVVKKYTERNAHNKRKKRWARK